MTCLKCFWPTEYVIHLKENHVHFETNLQLKLAAPVNNFTNNLLPYLLKTFLNRAFSYYMDENTQSLQNLTVNFASVMQYT
jgi:hypothetical protein